MKIQETKDAYINIDKKDCAKIANLSAPQISLYLYLCTRQTFTYKIFGIFRRESFTTLRHGFHKFLGKETFKSVKDIQRACGQLEKKNLIKILNQKDNLIIALDISHDLQFVALLVRNDYKAFNLYLPRIKELATLLSLDYPYFVNLFIATEQAKRALEKSKVISREEVLTDLENQIWDDLPI